MNYEQEYGVSPFASRLCVWVCARVHFTIPGTGPGRPGGETARATQDVASRTTSFRTAMLCVFIVQGKMQRLQREAAGVYLSECV